LGSEFFEDDEFFQRFLERRGGVRRGSVPKTKKRILDKRVKSSNIKTMKTKIVSKVPIKSAARDSEDARIADRIILGATDLFFQFGFSRVTMDEIASQLAMSKATIYKHFSAKEEIIRAVVGRIMAAAEAGMKAHQNGPDADFMGRVVGALSFVGRIFSKMRKTVVLDIQRYAPDMWKEIEEFRRGLIRNNFKAILESGVREGYLVGDIDLEILISMYLQIMDGMINPEYLSQAPVAPSEVFRMVLTVFFRGILTDQGRKKFAVDSDVFVPFKREG
jgi:AcrR family transcriptional regulator